MRPPIIKRTAAVFLDRDGTINEDPGYLHDPDQLRLLEGAAEAIALLNRHGLPVILVTNQAGIARGYYTEQEFWQVQERMAQLLGAAGAHLDAVYFCPHHPDVAIDPFRMLCLCRKPAPGMLVRAAAEHGIDLNASYMVGDKPSDILAGAAVGCRTVLVAEKGYPFALAIKPHHIADTLASAVQWLLADLSDLAGRS